MGVAWTPEGLSDRTVSGPDPTVSSGRNFRQEGNLPVFSVHPCRQRLAMSFQEALRVRAPTGRRAARQLKLSVQDARMHLVPRRRRCYLKLCLQRVLVGTVIVRQAFAPTAVRGILAGDTVRSALDGQDRAKK